MKRDKVMGNVITDSVIITITEEPSTLSTPTTPNNSSTLSNTGNGLSGFGITLIIAGILSMGSVVFYFIRKRGYI